MDSLEGILSCPIGTEEEPVQDLSPLPCSHYVSLRAWRTYEAKNPGKKLRCPVCNANVDKLGEPLPMGRIGEILKGLREECQWLKGMDDWNRAISSPLTQPTVPDVTLPQSTIPDAALPLIDFESDEPQASSSIPMPPSPAVALFLNDVRAHHGQTNDSYGKRVSPEPREPIVTVPSQSAPERDMPGLALGRWIESTDSPESMNLWGIELQDRNTRRLSDRSQEDVSQVSPGVSVQDTVGRDSAYYSLSHAGSETASTPIDSGPLHRGPLRSDTLPPYSPLGLTSHHPDFDVSSGSSQAVLPSPVAMYIPEQSVNSWVDQHMQMRPSGAPRQEDSKASEAPVPSTSRTDDTAYHSPPPSSACPKPLNMDVDAPSTLLGNLPAETRNNNLSSVEPVKSPTRPERKLSFASSLRMSIRRAPSDAPSATSDYDPTIKAFHMRAAAREHPGHSKRYQATAISPTCLTIALVNPSEFIVYSIGNHVTSKLICCGFNDGRFGETRTTARKDFESLANPRFLNPTYLRASMSDRVVCIACKESCVDIHATTTGRRIGTVKFPNRMCSSIKMAPNGQLLAVGTETGDVLIYTAGADENFVTAPRVIQDTSKLITCLAFSPDSTYVATCTRDNIIRTYVLEMGMPTLVSTYDRNLTPKSCRAPYFGVTAISLYLLKKLR